MFSRLFVITGLMLSLWSAQAAEIQIVNQDQPGVGFNDPTPASPVGGNTGQTLGEQRLIAAQWAADLWGGLLESDHPIQVAASFSTTLPCNLPETDYASSRPYTFSINFPNVPNASTWYPVSLANALALDDLNEGDPEILLEINLNIDSGCLSGKSFYLGLDAQAGADIDLVSIIFHKLSHGLGLIATKLQDPANAPQTFDDIYEFFLEDHSTGTLWKDMTSQEEREASATDSGDLHWIGSQALAAASGLTQGIDIDSGHIIMYAPAVLETDSVIHLTSDFNPDQMLEPGYQGPNHDPGIALGMLYDLGWAPALEADVELTLSTPSNEIDVASPFQMSVHLTNHGPGQASALLSRINWSNELTFQSASGDGEFDPDTQLWTASTLSSGSSWTLNLTFLPSQSGYPEIQGELLTCAQNDPDSTPGNAEPSEDDQDQLTLTAAQILNNGTLIQNLSASQSQWLLFKINVPSGQSLLSFSSFGGRGDHDLVAKQGAPPTFNDFDAASQRPGNQELISIDNPSPGTWYLGLYGFLDFEAVHLTGSYSSSDLKLTLNRTLRANCPGIILDLSLFEGQTAVTGATDFNISDDGGPGGPPETLVELAPGHYQVTYTTTQLHGGDVFPAVSVNYAGKTATALGLFNNCTLDGSYIQTWIDQDYEIHAGHGILIPIEVEAIEQGFHINSFEIELAYDPNLLEFSHITQQSSLTEDWDLVYANGSNPGTVLISAASTQQFELDTANPGVLLGIFFDLSKEASCNACSDLTFTRVVYNNGSPRSVAEHGRVCLRCSGGIPVADLELDKTVIPESVYPGDPIDFVIRVVNQGPHSTSNVTVRDLLGWGTSFHSFSGDGTYDEAQGIWTIGTMYPQTEAHLTLRAIGVAPGHFVNTASVRTSSSFDPDSTPGDANPLEDDTDEVDFYILSPGNADLILTKTVDDPNPRMGQDVTFTLTLQNDGPDPATDIQVIDRFIEYGRHGMAFVSAVGDGSFDGTSGIWTLPSLLDTASAQIDLTFSITSIGTLVNTAEVLSCNQADPNSTPNNQDSAENDQDSIDVLVQHADLNVALTCDDETPLVNDVLNFVVTISNEGTDTAMADVKVVLPDGIQYQSDDSGGLFQSNSGLWPGLNLASGASTQLSIMAQVISTEPQTVEAEVIHSDQGDPDSTPNNHLPGEDDHDLVNVVPQIADLELTLSVDNQLPNIGDQITLTCDLTNQGPHSATQVEVEIAPTSPFSLVSSSGGSYDAVSDVWTVGTIDANTPQTLTLVLSKDAAGSGSIWGEVLQSDPFDPDSTPANGPSGEDDEALLSLGLADLSLTSFCSNLQPEMGAVVSIDLTMTNSGPDEVNRVTIDILHGNGFVFQTATGDGTFDHAARSWTLEQPILSGQTASISFDYKIYGFIQKSWKAEIATSDQPDPDSVPGNREPSEDDLTEQIFSPECGTGATITILNADAPGEGFNDPTPVSPVGGNTATTRGEQRMIAFQRAAEIWAMFLTSDVDILVEAQFDPLTCSSSSGILGAAGPVTVARDFQGAPINQTWYPIALANSLAGTDLHGDTPDVRATFNSSIDQNNGCLAGVNWYYGLDGNPGSDMDFVSVLLHEMGHGLGFLTLVNGQTGARFMNMNDIYMLYLESKQTGSSWPNMSNAERAASAVSSTDLVWGGPQLTSNSGDLTAGTANDGRVEMFAPNPYQQGSSVSHFSTSLVPNELMEPYYTGPNHDPGHALDLFFDIGWGCQPSQDQMADLSLELLPATDQPLLNQELVIQLHLTNEGPDSTSAVRVDFNLPSELIFVSSSGSGTYDHTSGEWSLATVDANTTLTHDIIVTVDRLNSIPIEAEVQSSSLEDPDSTPGNGVLEEDDMDAKELAPILEPVADLSLGGTVSDSTPEPGDNIQIVLSLHNRGTHTATNPIVHFDWTTGCSFVSSDGAFDSGTQLWTAGILEPGQSEDVHITLNVTATGTIDLMAQVTSSDLPDPDSTPNNGLMGEDDDWTTQIYGQPEIPDCTDCAQITLDIRDSEGEGFLDATPVDPIGGNTGTTLGEQRILAFEYAIRKFCSILKANGPITAAASFDPLTCDATSAILGAASPEFFVRDFEDSPLAATWYPGALANALSGADYYATHPEISATFNSNIDIPDPVSGPGPCEESTVEYVVEIKHGSYIKFEDADPEGLGEDHTYMKDTFVIEVSGGTNSVLVGMKASTTRSETLVGEGDTVLLGTLGFQVTLKSIIGNTYTFEVDSPCNPHALSHIFFDFGQGIIASPTQAGYTANRQTCENGWSSDCTPPTDPDACLAGVNWYYGLDGKPAGNELDFVSVVLHELTHGLGFLSTVNFSDGSLFMGYSDAYSHHLEDHSNGLTWPEMSNSERLYSTTDSDLHWTGPFVVDQAYLLSGGVNADGHVSMFSPNPVQVGSSVSHWSTSLTPNELMEPHYSGANHNFGLAAPALWDIGWERVGCIDLELDMVVDELAPLAGETVTFTLDLVNQGPRSANLVLVQSLLGDGLAYQSHSGDGSFIPGTGTWQVGTMLAGDEVGLDIVCLVQAGQKRHTVEVLSVDEPDEDSIPNNQNPAEDDYTRLILGLADLELSITSAEAEYLTEEEFSVTLTLENQGPDDASGVFTSVDLPATWVLTHDDALGFFNRSTGLWDVDQVPAFGTRALTLYGFVLQEQSLHLNAQVSISDLIDPDSTPGNGYNGEDDDASIELDILEPLSDLDLTMLCITPLDCPQTRVSVLASRSGQPQIGLSSGQFELRVDGQPIAYSFASGLEDGVYEFTFDLPSADGALHSASVKLLDQGHEANATELFTSCHTSGCATLFPSQTIDHLSGVQGQWRCFRIEIPANQASLSVRSFFGSGDADLYLRRGAPPTLQTFDSKSGNDGNQEDISISYPAGGAWYVGLYGYSDYCDASSRVELLQADLSLEIDTVFTDNCPSVGVEVHVSRDQLPVTWLQKDHFQVKEDGFELPINAVVQDPAGTYLLQFTTIRPDAQPHELEITVEIQGEYLSASTTYENCLGSCMELMNNQIVGQLAGIPGSWRCFFIDVPSGQDVLESLIFNGLGDADIFLKLGSQPTPLDYDAYSNQAGSNDFIGIEQPAAGRWFIGLQGVSSYRDLNILARYYVRDLTLEIVDVSIATCPDISITANVFTNDLPVTSLGTADFELFEENGQSKTISGVTHLGNGQYQITYRTQRTQGQETTISLTVNHNAKTASDADIFSNCTRRGGALDVWINDEHRAPAGSLIRIPVHVSPIIAGFFVESFSFELEYDPTLINYQNAYATGSLITPWPHLDDSATTPGRIRIQASSMGSGFIESNQEDILVFLEFEVDPFAAVGDCTPLEFTQDSFIFNDGVPVALTDDGLFCVSSGCFGAIGDVDTDGNAKEAWDALQIVRQITGIPTIYDPIPICVADTNCSGTVSLIDPILILQRSVRLIDAYCEGKSSKSVADFELEIPHLVVAPGESFEIPIELTQLPADPAYGYSLDVQYDPNYVNFYGATRHDGTLSERWSEPLVNSQVGGFSLTQFDPYTPIEQPGNLVILKGSAGFDTTTTQFTLTRFALATNGEPERSFGPFTIEIQGSPCFDVNLYNQELSQWDPSIRLLYST